MPEFKLTFLWKTIGTFPDLRSAWLVLRFLGVKEIRAGGFGPYLYGTIYVEEKWHGVKWTRHHSFDQMVQQFGD